MSIARKLELKEVTNTRGDTPLHQAIRSCKSSTEIMLFIHQLAPKTAIEMVRSINDQGELPYDLALKKRDRHLSNKLSSMLFKLMKKNNLKKLSETIDPIEVVSRYHFPINSKIYHNLVTASLIVNETRKVIKESDTHPEINEYSEKRKRLLRYRIKEMRSKKPIINNSSYCKMLVTHPVKSLVDPEGLLIEEDGRISAEEGTGNCHEKASFAYYSLRKKDAKIPAKLCYLAEGDHVFLTFGEDSSTVVCDPWSGEVYPFDEVNLRLTGCKRYEITGGSYVFVATSYNSKFHSIETIDPLENIEPSPRCGLMLMGALCALGLFAMSRLSTVYAATEFYGPTLK